MNSYEHTSRDFLPLSVIRSACAGDTDAVEQVLRHYRGYINKLCTGILYDKHGQPHVCIHRMQFTGLGVPQQAFCNANGVCIDRHIACRCRRRSDQN